MSSQSGRNVEFMLVQTTGSRHNTDELFRGTSLEEIREFIDAKEGH